MKKLTKILCFIMAVLCLAGCAGQGNNASDETVQTTQQDDGVMNILLVGNSACYYFTDELWGMLDAAGYEEVNVYNLYYSGASLQQHYNWWKNNESACELICVNAEGRRSTKGMNIKDAVGMQDWDYVSVIQAFKYFLTTPEDAMNSITPYLGELLELIREKAPNAKLFWEEPWSSEVGEHASTVNIDSMEKRASTAATVQQVSPKIAETYGLTVVPLSSVWESVRDNPAFAQPGEGSKMEKFTLCTRIQNGQLMDDLGHDGDVGGGQYLNACVFYEVLTGKDCRENTFRPKYTYMNMDYSLTEEEIGLLQNAAHKGVAG